MKPLYKNTTSILVSAQNIKLNNEGKVVFAENITPRKILGLIRTMNRFSKTTLADEVSKKTGINMDKEGSGNDIIIYLDTAQWLINVDAFASSKTESYGIADAAGNLVQKKVQTNLDKIQPGKKVSIYKATIFSPARTDKTYQTKPRPLKTAIATFLLVIFLAACINILIDVMRGRSEALSNDDK